MTSTSLPNSANPSQRAPITPTSGAMACTQEVLAHLQICSQQLYQQHFDAYQQYQDTETMVAGQLLHQLIQHFRHTIHVTSTVLRQHEGILWGTTSGASRVGDGTTLRLAPPQMLGEGFDAEEPTTPEQAQVQCQQVLEVLEGLEPVELAIQTYLPHTLQPPSPSGSASRDPRALHPVAQGLSPLDAARTAVMLHGRSLLLRDAYLLWSLLHLTSEHPEQIPDTSTVAAVSHQRRRLAQGLMLLKQSNQAVDAIYLSTSVLTLLLPYSDATRAFEEPNTSEDPNAPPSLQPFAGGGDSVERQMYRKVVHHTKAAYKAESRLSQYCHELVEQWRTTTPPMELRQLVQRLMEEYNILRGAKNELQLCVLQAHAGSYEASLKRGHRAVQILWALCRQYSGSLLAVDAGGVMGNAKEAEEVQAFVLLPIALYNLACTIDRMARRKAVEDPASRGNPERREARDTFFQAFRLAEQFLGPQHEVVRELTRVFGAARLEKWKARVMEIEAAKEAERPESHGTLRSSASGGGRPGSDSRGDLYLSSSSTSAHSFGHPAPPPAALRFPNKKPPHHLPIVTSPSPLSAYHSTGGSGSETGVDAGLVSVLPPYPNAPAPMPPGHAVLANSMSLVSSSGASARNPPLNRFLLGKSPVQRAAGAFPQSPSPSGIPQPPPPPRTDGGESTLSGGSREAPGIQFLNKSVSSFASGSKKGSLAAGGRRASLRSRSILSDLRSSHRLERPDDALSLGGPTPEFIPPNPSKEEEERREKEATQQRKRERRIRTFLPEEIEKKKKKKAEKQARRERRERHEQKKELRARQEQARVAAEEADALRRATEAYYARLDSHMDGDDGTPPVPDETPLPSPGSLERHGSSTATALQEPLERENPEEKVPQRRSLGAVEPAAPQDAAAAAGGRSRRGSGSDGGVTRPPSGKKPGREQKKTVKEHSAAASHTLAPEGSADRLSQHSSSAVLHDRLLVTARPVGADGKPLEDDDLSSLSSVSLPPSSTDGSEDEEEDGLEEETVEERKDRYDIELQIYFLCLHRKRHKAACVLQRAWRCSVARLELYNRRQFFYMHLYKTQKAAALCIVGFMRSMQNRKQRERTLKKRQVEDLARAEQERQEIQAVHTLERCFTRYLERKHRRDRLRKELNLERDTRLSKYEAAAIIVQRWWRIIPQVRAYWTRRAVEVKQERLEREREECRHASAAKIQALIRGVQTRRQVRRWKAQRQRDREELRCKLVWSTDLVQLALSEWCLRTRRLEREAQQDEERQYQAVDCISHGWQNALARRRFELALAKARRIRHAAELIQRAYKRYYAARERRYLRELSQTAEAERVDYEFLFFRATLRLQCFARVVLAKAAYRRQRARYGRGVLYALTVLQSVGRGCLARRQFDADRVAAYEARRIAAETAESRRQRHTAVLQAWCRSKHSAVRKEKKACQRLYDKIYIRRLVRQELHREKAAAAIQRAFRCHLQLKRAFYADYERRCAESVAWMAVVKIQCAWRQWRARQAVQRRRWWALQASRKRLVREDVIASQWLTDTHVFFAEFDHGRRRIANLESDMRDMLAWVYTKETNAVMGIVPKAGEEQELLPMNVTAALEGYLNNEYMKKWGGLYDDDDDDAE